ncbi:MAG: KH domain-containing protein [Bacillus subtilis]|nr:KH domain-containing protein [Bacillus subtilis]
MKLYRFETKDLNDQTKKLAAAELGVSKDFVELKIVDEKKNGFFNLSRTYTVEATVQFDLVKDSIAYLQTMLNNMEVEAFVEARQTEERQIVFTVETSENPLLIGKNGKTLDAIQTLIKNLMNVFTDENHVALVDVGGYKEQRKKQLEILATKTAKEVARTKIKARLGKMNAYERRVIHTKLAEWRDVTTESEGEEPNRYVVIKPKYR